MIEEKAQELLNKLIDRTKKIVQKEDSSYTKNIIPQLLDNLDFQLVQVDSATSLKDGSVYLATNKKYLERVGLGNKEELVFAFVFFHEFGHQLQNVLNLPQNQLDTLFSNYAEARQYGFSIGGDVQFSPESLPLVFKNPHILDFYNRLEYATTNDDEYGFSDNQIKPFITHSEEEANLLQNHARQMESISSEQFSDCFAIAMMKKVYPNHYESVLSNAIARRSSTEKLMGNDIDTEKEVGYIHRTHASLIDMNELIKKNLGKDLDSLVDGITSVVEKNTLLSMKNIMSEEKTLAYFPKQLNAVIELQSDSQVASFKIDKNTVKVRMKAMNTADEVEHKSQLGMKHS